MATHNPTLPSQPLWRTFSGVAHGRWFVIKTSTEHPLIRVRSVRTMDVYYLRFFRRLLWVLAITPSPPFLQ
jgi:hypothetical protein